MAMAYPLGVNRAQTVRYIIYQKDHYNDCCGRWCVLHLKDDKLRREADTEDKLRARG